MLRSGDYTLQVAAGQSDNVVDRSLFCLVSVGNSPGCWEEEAWTRSARRSTIDCMCRTSSNASLQSVPPDTVPRLFLEGELVRVSPELCYPASKRLRGFGHFLAALEGVGLRRNARSGQVGARNSRLPRTSPKPEQRKLLLAARWPPRDSHAPLEHR
jgi:hypothetical protein